MNNLIHKARHIPVRDPVLTLSISPVRLSVPARDMPLEMRITAPMKGDQLPIILLSHGHGPSLYPRMDTVRWRVSMRNRASWWRTNSCHVAWCTAERFPR